jgi:hypothetical protein
MSESAVSSVYQFLIILIGGILFIFLMAFLWRWIFKIDRQLRNQEAIIALLIIQAKKQGASEQELKIIIDKLD